MFDLDMAELFFSVVLSIIGLGYCSYGRKQSPYYLCCGLGLLLIPYFIDNFWWLLAVGSVLILLPYLLDR